MAAACPAAYGYVHDPAELELVRAGLRAGPLTPAALALAVAALEQRADRGVVRLLPLLRRHPELPRDLAGGVERAYRDSLLRHLRLEQRLAEVVAALRERGIEALLLKGAALARLHYPSPGLRPMGDLDIAIRPARFAEALRAIQALGYAPPSRPMVAAGPGTHAVPLVDGSGTTIDLHCNVLVCSRWVGADDGFWSRSIPCGLRGIEARSLAPPDLILHVCLHGIRGGIQVKTIRWLVDLAMILRQPLGEAAWATLVDEAGRHRCERPLAAALGYAGRHLLLPVPAEVTERLAATRGHLADDRYFRLLGRLTDRPSLGQRLAMAVLDYRRYAQGGRILSPAFPRWLQQRWELPSLRGVLAEGLRRMPLGRSA